MTVSPANNRLLKTARARLPGAGEDAVMLEYHNTALELCTKTGVWYEEIVRNIVAGRSTYSIRPDSTSADPGYLLDLKIDGRRYRPISGAYTSNAQWSGAYRVSQDMDSICIVPEPQASQPKAIRAMVTLIPHDETVLLPDAIVAHHFEPLIDGLMGRMLSHINKPYSDKETALYHQRRFRAHITRVRRIVRGGNAKADVPWRYPTQAPGRNLRGATGRGV